MGETIWVNGLVVHVGRNMVVRFRRVTARHEERRYRRICRLWVGEARVYIFVVVVCRWVSDMGRRLKDGLLRERGRGTMSRQFDWRMMNR